MHKLPEVHRAPPAWGEPRRPLAAMFVMAGAGAALLLALVVTLGVHG